VSGASRAHGCEHARTIGDVFVVDGGAECVEDGSGCVQARGEVVAFAAIMRRIGETATHCNALQHTATRR